MALLTAGCSGTQSSLDPAGPAAAAIHQLGIVLYVGAAVVTLLVCVLMLLPLWRRRPVNPGRIRQWFLWGGGVALPLISLSLLVPYVFSVGSQIRGEPGQVSVDITGHLYWWEVGYQRADGRAGLASANELRLPAGEPVLLRLRSADVIHSFWVPSLAGKLDMIPGRVNHMVIQADRPGVYRGQCAEYCGRQHSLMALDVIVLPPEEFEAWLARLDEPAPEPVTAELRRGRDLYLDLGCAACHTVRGVSEGRFGPDLTQVGSRRSLGAGTLPGGVGNLAAWVASAQHLKPGNAMPSYDQLSGAELRALAAYLGSLQ